MRLFYSVTSPYARKIRVFLDCVAGQSTIGDIETINCNPLDDAPELLAANPLGKVPTLILDDGRALIESLAIVQYLQQQGAIQGDLAFAPTDVGQLQRHALANGMTDAALNLVMERRRDEPQRSPYWQHRWERAINKTIAAFNNAPPPAARFDLGDIALAVALEYIDFRLPDINWRADAAALAAWLADVSELPSMVATRPE
ncbi:MAG: glutathione S-transferase family protein [Pseudomonadota bacterium]